MKNKCLILIAEDDPSLAYPLHDMFEDNDFRVLITNNGEEALELYRSHSVDLILMDIDMPVKNGLEVMFDIRLKDNHTPIIIMTGYHQSEDDCVESFEKGATSFIRKPFSHKELLMQVNALLNTMFHMRAEWKFGNSILDRTSKILIVDSVEHLLKERETTVLSILLKHKNQVVELPFFFKYIWKDKNKRNHQMLKNTINSLKKKLASDPSISLESAYGLGYLLKVP